MLHPTPAVGGAPQEEALRVIARMEPFSRGWYSAPLGVISGQHADFTVGLRSTSSTPEQVVCYVGVGLVEGSSANEELKEIDAKLASF
jgi:menaquinone-specific isochorismate synthase